MATFKMIAKSNRRGPNSTGGIPNSGLPKMASARVNKDGGFVSRNVAEPKGFKGTTSPNVAFPDNKFSRSATKIAANYPASGDTDRLHGPQARAGRDALYRPAGSTGATQVNFNSGGAAVKVAATGKGGMGGSHNRAQPSGVDEAPQIARGQSDKTRTAGSRGETTTNSRGGFVGSGPNAANAVGHFGSGLGKKRKTSFF